MLVEEQSLLSWYHIMIFVPALKKYCQVHQLNHKQPSTSLQWSGKTASLRMQLMNVLLWIILVEQKKGLPRDPNPSVRTVGEQMATSRAKGRVMNSITRVGSLEQQRLILLKVLSDPSIRDISSSIGINMKEIKLGQQLLRCARKLVWRSQNSR